MFEKTLYHGTISDNIPSIEENGLVPTVGEFVKHAYAGSAYGDTEDYLQALLYATDKKQLYKAKNAIIYQIANKLGKSFHSVTNEDFKKYGALAVIKNGDDYFKFHSQEDEEYGGAPLGVESRDYYTGEEILPDYILTGEKMTSFFKKYGLYPIKKAVVGENILKEMYDFGSTAIDVTEENYKEALELREKYPSFKGIGVGTFLTNVILWRCIDENEFNIIRKTGKITGGTYALPAERAFGPSFSGSRPNVIKWGLRIKENGRFKGQLYVIGVNGEEKEFLNLNMEGRFKEQGLEYKPGVFDVNTKLGDVGLGYSIRNVNFKMGDVISVYTLNDNGMLGDITHDVL